MLKESGADSRKQKQQWFHTHQKNEKINNNNKNIISHVNNNLLYSALDDWTHLNKNKSDYKLFGPFILNANGI